MHIEYLSAHHDKSPHMAYVMIPAIAASIMKDKPDVAGFVFGGSYASGKYAWGDDVDFDLLFESYPVTFSRDLMDESLQRTFALHSYIPHMRLPLAANTISPDMRSTTYIAHPDTPFIVRTSHIAEKWGLK